MEDYVLAILASIFIVSLTVFLSMEALLFVGVCVFCFLIFVVSVELEED